LAACPYFNILYNKAQLVCKGLDIIADWQEEMDMSGNLPRKFTEKMEKLLGSEYDNFMSSLVAPID
jgi:hypothetical protein